MTEFNFSIFLFRFTQYIVFGQGHHLGLTLVSLSLL